MFKQLDDTGLEDSDPNKRSLSIIGKRHCIVTHEIPINNFELPDITNIPEGITVNSINESDSTNKDNITSNDDESVTNVRVDISFNMIIDVLSEVILNQMREEAVINQDTSDLVHNIKDSSFKSVTGKYTLDFKQSVAFEIMASSFLLKSLHVGNICEIFLRHFLKEMKMKGLNMQHHWQV